ncbi:MAG: RagB/SusD family nutrient uptake outer membrane protein [Prevotella sp.]|nr:RagB/SusD family nutrient uptake outer membrane protein [Candidatus Equicola faecalis]
MKLNKILYGAVGLIMFGSVFTSCTDDVAFGDASLDKAASSTATIETVFGNPEYARQFLVGIYSKQYYGLPHINGGTYAPHASNPYAGKWDALTDCWHQFWNGSAVYGQYYTGSMTPYVNRDDGLDGPLYSFDKEFQWWGIRSSQIFLENIGKVPEMDNNEKARLKSEARCLMVSYFWQTFQHFGGIPIIDHALDASEATAQMPRDSVENCINWMVNQLDSAINESNFPWVTADPTNMSGRWTKAGAMALKCKILQFAASPLLNPKDGKPYYEGAPEEVLPFIMYTDPSQYQARWDRFATACDEFFNALNANGYYQLVTADGLKGSTEANVPQFRLAYRRGYFLRESTEVLHSVRVMGYDNSATARYGWHSWYSKSVPRNAYCPTHEYVAKFPYYDGEPFNWDNAAKKTYKNNATEPDINVVTDPKTGEELYTEVSNFQTNSKTGKITYNKKSLHTMFVRGSIAGRALNAIHTRDPRLYEECIVNGQQINLDWTSASVSGFAWELWYNGNDGGTGVLTQQNTMFGSGYGFNKYYLGAGGYQGDTNGDSYRYQTQWVELSLADMYLTYAEALVMRSAPNVAKAVEMIDIVRARVGLPSAKVVWTNSTNRSALGYEATTAESALTTSVALGNGATSNEFIEELLDERARELGLTNARWFDMIRYKRTDWMTKQLHALYQRRLVQQGKVFQTRDKAWVGADRDNDPTSTQPLDFLNKIVDITGYSRYLWGKDPKSTDVQKWLLDPLPQAEMNKGYGLVQNPGW